MVFMKKKTAEVSNSNPKENKQPVEDPRLKELADSFNLMIEDYGILSPEQFKDETKVLQHNMLFAIYMEIKKLRETIEKLENE